MCNEMTEVATRRAKAEALAALETVLDEHPPIPASGEQIAELVRAARRA